MRKYNEKFYQDRHRDTLHSAETILAIVQPLIPELRSAVDVGCGVGSWLYVLQERGVGEILGIDGAWVKKDHLKINPDLFQESDLNQTIPVAKKFDLAISLEVAEHLHPKNAQTFVQSLTRLSDFILFSAAVPGQGGTEHVNEQWQEYWVERFQQQGYSLFDVIRWKIWNDASIPFWYKQNTFLFVKSERAAEVILKGENEEIPICVIHPDLYTLKVVRPSIIQSLKSLKRSIKNFIKH